MQSTVLHFYLSKHNPTPQKAERNRGYEGVPPPPPAARARPEALSLPILLPPNRASLGQLLQHLALNPRFRPAARRDADVVPRSRRLHTQLLPPPGPFPPGGTAAPRHGRRAGRAGRVLPAAGHAAPSGLALAAARPSPV